jgi:hypothetical protein
MSNRLFDSPGRQLHVVLDNTASRTRRKKAMTGSACAGCSAKRSPAIHTPNNQAASVHAHSGTALGTQATGLCASRCNRPPSRYTLTRFGGLHLPKTTDPGVYQHPYYTATLPRGDQLARGLPSRSPDVRAPASHRPPARLQGAAFSAAQQQASTMPTIIALNSSGCPAQEEVPFNPCGMRSACSPRCGLRQPQEVSASPTNTAKHASRLAPPTRPSRKGAAP